MQQLSRRALLRAGVTMAAVIAVPAFVPGQGLATGPAVRLRRREFTPHAGTRFALVAGAHTYDARLVKIGDHDRAGGDEARFTLLFDVRGPQPPEGIYTVRHPRMKPFDLFIAPVGSAPVRYEAVVAS